MKPVLGKTVSEFGAKHKDAAKQLNEAVYRGENFQYETAEQRKLLGIQQEVADLCAISCGFASTNLSEYSTEQLSKAAKQCQQKADFTERTIQTTRAKTGADITNSEVVEHGGRTAATYNKSTKKIDFDYRVIGTARGIHTGVHEGTHWAHYENKKKKTMPTQISTKIQILQTLGIKGTDNLSDIASLELEEISCETQAASLINEEKHSYQEYNSNYTQASQAAEELFGAHINLGQAYQDGWLASVANATLHYQNLSSGKKSELRDLITEKPANDDTESQTKQNFQQAA